jgi:hypothetical protein
MGKELDKQLFPNLVQIIEQGKKQVAVQVNSTVVLTYWQVGKTINEHILNNERAEYSKEIVATVATQLVEQFGKSFETKNLYRMMQFADLFADFEIVVPLARQLSWSHFLALLPLKSNETRIFYAQKAIEANWGKRELRHQIDIRLYRYNRRI